MDSQPSALSAQIAGLRHAVQATPAAAWLPATLHALIIACLARLFTRLEQMLNLWQSGDLILPQATPRAAASREQRRRAPAAPRRRSRHRRARQTATPAPARHPRTIHRPAANLPSAARHRPRPARDPPPQNLKSAPSSVAQARSYYYDIKTNYPLAQPPLFA